MTSLRSHFNTRSCPMIYARDRVTSQIIGLPGDQSGEVDWYSEDLHKGRLICFCCDAPVHYNSGTDISHGSRKGSEGRPARRPHFKTNPDASHEPGCEMARDSFAVDPPTGGFRLNFNTSTSDYTEENPDSILPENLRALSLKSMADLAGFMRLNNIDRIKDSYAVYREHESAWPNFIMSDTNEGCRENLINTVSMMAKSHKTLQLACLELKVDKDKIAQPLRLSHKHIVKGRAVTVVERDKRGIKHIILPKFSFSSYDENFEDLKEVFSRSATFMGQGLAELYVSKWGDAKFYHFEIPVVSPVQVEQISLNELRKENRLHALKRQMLALKAA